MLPVYLSCIETDEDKSKFERIYTQYRGLMYFAAHRILGDARDAEDVVHQSFLKLLEMLDRIPVAVCPQTRSLVVTITERKAIDVYRARRRKAVLPLEEAALRTAAPPPDAAVERDAIAQAIAALPPHYCDLLLLKYDNGYSEREIAQILDFSEANVKKTIQRAKAKLRAALHEEGVDV